MAAIPLTPGDVEEEGMALAQRSFPGRLWDSLSETQKVAFRAQGISLYSRTGEPLSSVTKTKQKK